MNIKITPYNLVFKSPFRLAHGERNSTPCVFVSLSDGTLTGYGEATLPPYLGVSREMAENFILKVNPDILMTDSAEQLHCLSGRITPKCYPAMAALDMAWHDLSAQKHNVPLHQWLGLAGPYEAEGMFTIGIGSEEELIKKLPEADVLPVLKIKTSNGNEKEILMQIRKYTGKPVAIDANQSWELNDKTLELLHWLKEMNVIMVEQPFKTDTKIPSDIFHKSPVPLIADESFQTLEDLDRISGHYHGINIKLMKCGGLYPALQIIKEARKRNLKVMIGCMSESSCGCSAAAHLLSLADWYDLDGPLLISNDPFDGLTYEKGKIVLNGRAGIGIQPNSLFEANNKTY